jgi:hypothetical protein
MFLWNLNWSLYPPDVNPLCSHMRWFSLLRRDGTPLPVFERVASMTRRPSDYLPRLTLYAENMTVETSTYCPGSILVGEFQVLNSGYPGTFTATVQTAVPPGGPEVEVFPPDPSAGDTVQVYADTTNLRPGLHTIYLNVAATIEEEAYAQMIQGYIVIGEGQEGCE